MESKKTELLNKGKENKNAKKDLNAGVVAGVAGAAGVAVGFASETILNPEVETEVEDVNEMPTVIVEAESENEPEVVVAEPIVEEPVVVAQEPTPTLVQEPVQDVVETQISEEVVVSQENTDTNGEESTDFVVEPENNNNEQLIDTPVLPGEDVNPDDIAETILSGQEIDPNDIDADEMIMFDDINMVYTVDGQSYATASFHDTEGNSMLMADLDGDMEFDVVLTPEGYEIGDISGINASDAEMMISEEPDYMAQNEFDENTSFEGENFENDMMLS